MSFKEFLNEVFVHGQKADGKTVIAFKENIWIVDESITESEIDKIFQTIRNAHSYKTTLSDLDLNNLVSLLLESYYDVVIGNIHNNTLYLSNNEYTSPATSLTVKKLAKALNIKIASERYFVGHNSVTKMYKKKELKGDIPDELYHGTSFKNAEGILKTGLTPRKITGVSTNFSAISHENTVFLTSEPSKATFHSYTAEKNLKRNSINDEYGYIVFKFKIPDKSKLIPDYDAERETNQGTFTKSAMSASKHFGSFGYAGRIPASFITKILIFYENSDKPVIVNNIEKFKSMFFKDPETTLWKVKAAAPHSYWSGTSIG